MTTARTDLAASIQHWPRPIFMTLDGSLLRNPPDIARRAGFAVRSLYIEHRNQAAILAGPWFAALDDRALANALRIEGIGRCAVFWSGAIDEAVAYRHFRSINLADLPRPRDAPPDPFAADPETVIFRHADPSVLALVLPVLDPGQRARLFGPMNALLIDAPSLGGVREARRRPDWPDPPRGRLRLSQTQLDQIAAAMTERSHAKIASFLRNTAPTHTASITNEALQHLIARSDATGRGLGLTTERGLGRFAYLMLITQGAIASSTPARRWIETGSGTPDDRVGQVLLAIAGSLHRHEIGA